MGEQQVIRKENVTKMIIMKVFKRISKITIILFFIILMMANLSIFRIFFSESFYYSNSEGTFREFEMHIKGRDYAFIQRRFNSFKEENPNSLDTILYLNDKKNYLKFWNWYDYGDHPRWNLPFRPTDSLLYNYNGTKK